MRGIKVPTDATTALLLLAAVSPGMIEDRNDAGRGMLVGDDITDAQREAIAEELVAGLLEKRRTDWRP